MRITPLIAVAGVAALLTGCRSHGDVDLLLRELRMQEDKIFTLQDELALARVQLESSRRAYASLRDGEVGMEAVPTKESDRAAPADADSPFSDGDDIDAGEPGKFEIDLGAPIGEPARLGPVDLTAMQRTDIPEVAEIAMNQLLSGGYDEDGHPGDDGIMVVLETKDQAGQSLAGEGAVSILILDPAKPEHQGRLARWDFTPDEAAAHFRRTAFGNGLHFELPWPDQAPESSEIRIVARMETLDGRLLFADRKVRIDLAGQPNARIADAGSPALTAVRMDSSFVGDWKSRQDRPTGEAKPAPLTDETPTMREEARPTGTSSLARRPRWTPYR